jgi:tetratricopeptide (TPR) repeat protein
MNKLPPTLLTALLLAGCQSLGGPAPGGPADPNETPAPVAQTTYASFSEETLYALLAAELAGQRNQMDYALENYNAQAKITRDPAVAERAFRMAEYLGEPQAALDNALIWVEVAPANLEAQTASAIQLARAGRHEEAMGHMEVVLQARGDTHFDFVALTAANSDAQTRGGLLQSFDRLLQRYPDNPQLLFGRSLLLQQDGQAQAALDLLEDSRASSSEPAILLLQANLLDSLDRQQDALELLDQGLREYPDDKSLRLAHARLLVDQEQLREAIAAFTELLQRYPEDDDLRLSLALLYLQDNALDEAAVYLRELIDNGSHMNIARYNLGRIDEERGDSEAALIGYSLIGPGDEFIPAQARYTDILIRIGRSDAARSNLQEQRERHPEYAVELFLLESEIFASHGQTAVALQVLNTALEQFPDDDYLLYSRAMLAAEGGDIAELERDLRTIIRQNPDNAMALNALGFTLADQTDRYAEALNLIERAHQINPQDPAIIDSLGWVHYRLGNLDKAEARLREALTAYPDPEIAAHLGEVLWVRNKQSEARQVWREALKKTPDSEILRSTVLRLTGAEQP